VARRGGHGGHGGGGHGGGKGGGGKGRRKWDDEDEGEGIFNVGSGYKGKSKPRRGERNPEESAEPLPEAAQNATPLPPSASDRFPGYPVNRTLSPQDEQHILAGHPTDLTSGGHRHGTGRPDKTEFPEDWDDARITRNVQDVADNPDSAVDVGDGTWYVTGTRDGVQIGGFVRTDGSIKSGFPISGPGVTRNPPATP
jgi:hypothetical protein